MIRQELSKILDKKTINHKTEILKKETLKDAHIYCKINNFSGQKSGPLLEHYIKEKNNMTKSNSSLCIGDCKTNKNKKNRNKNIIRWINA
jgi:hypothetical protein